MSSSANSTPNPPSTVVAGQTPVPISGPWPTVISLFMTAAFWLVVAALLALIASIKFHSPQFLADIPWLTYGRVRAAHMNVLLYGFCIPGGLAAALWVLLRTCSQGLVGPFSAAGGAVCFNIGALLGLGGILAGDNTGYESFEIPLYSVVFVVLGYVLTSIPALLTLHARERRAMSVPQWYLIAAIFWFPWICSTAAILLLVMPVRGIAQSVIAWWYAANLQFVWLGLVGLAIGFHILPRAVGCELNSRNTALFAFWMLLLFGSLTGVPQTAPVPAWLPSLSTAATVVSALFFVAVLLAATATTRGHCREAWRGASAFVSFGIAALLLYGLVTVVPVVFAKAGWLPFTWLHLAQFNLVALAFFGSMILGAIHSAMEDLGGASSSRGGALFWLFAAGSILLIVPLIGAGVLQGIKLEQPGVAFVDISRSALHFLRLSTLGDLLVLLAALLVLWRLVSLVIATGRQQARDALARATAEVKR